MPLSTLIRRTAIAGAATVLASVGMVAIGAAPAEAVTCRAYTAIGVRGTGDGLRYSMGTQLPTAVNAFKARKGSANVATDFVVYQASLNYPVSLAEGTVVLRSMIDNYLTTCPSTKVALFGYSQGAHVVGNAAAGLNAAQRSRIQGVGLIGDTVMNPRLPSSSTANPYLGGMFGQRPGWPSGLFVHSVCNWGDQVCASYGTAQSYAYLATAPIGGAPHHLNYTTPTYSPTPGYSGAWLIGDHVARRA